MRSFATTLLIPLLAGSLSCAHPGSPTTGGRDGQVLPAIEADQAPVLDSVQVWYYPHGSLGQAPTIVFQAIVDTRGRVEPASIRLVSITDSSFELAARYTLMAAFYQPARAQGSPVRVLVQQPINYARASGRSCELPKIVTAAQPPPC